MRALSRHSRDSRFGGLCGDLVAGLRQQMFFWGRDVVYPSGNLLLSQGFVKTKSAGLQGTSCYGLDWQGGRIELHGACAGWYGPKEGFIFVRSHDRCRIWRGGGVPVPGEWPVERLEDAEPQRLYDAALPFLDWWLDSERWIVEKTGDGYRGACHRHFKKLPRSKSWLPPAEAMKWVESFRRNPCSTPRAKRFLRDGPAFEGRPVQLRVRC